QRAQILATQLARQMIGQRLLQPVMLQDGGMDEPASAGSRPAMASACWRRADQMGSIAETFSRGLGIDCSLTAACTTKACRISKRANAGLPSLQVPVSIKEIGPQAAIRKL